MSENIANQVTKEMAKRVLGCTAEAERRLLDEGLELDDFQVVIDDPIRRARLVVYWKAGMPEVNIWPIWRTIKRDPAMNSPKAFLSALALKKRKVRAWAEDIISKSAFSESLNEPEQEYDLFVLTTAQLTEKNGVGSTTDEVFAGIKRLGFSKCPVWIGLQLGLDYENQPNGEWIRVAMEPIRDSDGYLLVFYVGRDGSGLWLGAGCASPGSSWGPGWRWVVCLPRK